MASVIGLEVSRSAISTVKNVNKLSTTAQTRYMNRPRKPMYFFGQRSGGLETPLPFSCHILSYRFRQVLHCSTTSDEN